MKFFRKVNKGLILTVLVVIGVIIYITVLTASQSNDKKALERISSEYVKTEMELCVIPEEYRSDDKITASNNELEALVAGYKEKLKPFYCQEDGLLLQYSLEQIEDTIYAQKNGKTKVLEKAELNIIESDIKINSNKATVRLYAIVSMSQNYSGSINVIQSSVEDALEFIKTDDGWKIIKSDTTLPLYINNDWEVY